VSDYKWLFDGVGGTVALGLVGWLCRSLWRFWHKPAPAPAGVAPQAPSPIGSTPPVIHSEPERAPARIPPEVLTGIVNISFQEIARAIHDAPPLQRPEVAKRYHRLRIMWEDTTFRAAYLRREDKVAISLGIKGEFLSAVRCEVGTADYPILSVLPHGARVTVIGRIIAADGLDVELDEVRLFFPDHTV
jgi:hypothetical protein